MNRYDFTNLLQMAIDSGNEKMEKYLLRTARKDFIIEHFINEDDQTMTLKMYEEGKTAREQVKAARENRDPKYFTMEWR